MWGGILSLCRFRENPFLVFDVQVTVHLEILIIKPTRCNNFSKFVSETCRVLIQNRFEKLVHLVGFVIRILSRNCKLFRDPDGENSFIEMKCVILNTNVTIKKNWYDRLILQNK